MRSGELILFTAESGLVSYYCTRILEWVGREQGFDRAASVLFLVSMWIMIKVMLGVWLGMCPNQKRVAGEQDREPLPPHRRDGTRDTGLSTFYTGWKTFDFT
jgi:hypothetical protein